MPVPKEVIEINDYTWEIPKNYKKGMNVPAKIYATKTLLEAMDAGVFDQITNVATLPGLINYALAMPDAHWGYGAPIGAVFATDPKKDGIISPGSIGFDINCGMRLIRTDLTIKEVKPKLHALIDTLFSRVPSGVGSTGFIKPTYQEFKRMLIEGSKWCLKLGHGWEEDLQYIEEYGAIEGADPSKVSDKAISRGLKQLGTLGSGNHYLEVQEVLEENIYDKALAEKLGIFPGQIVVMVHCGSRGFGHQVATDYLRKFNEIMPKYGISVPDRELACAPFESPEGQDYYAAMACAANTAFANRQVITHRVRECFELIFGKGVQGMGMDIVYDVAHNIAKVEKGLIVHRKGATRSFGPGNKELSVEYQKTGQPVILGGSMETGSHLLVGTKKAEEETFGSTAHGSGRTMSRTKAKKLVRGDKLQKEMEQRGIYVRSVSLPGLAEEAGLAYKNISEVVEAVDKAGLSKKIVGFKPIGNIKG